MHLGSEALDEVGCGANLIGVHFAPCVPDRVVFGHGAKHRDDMEARARVFLERMSLQPETIANHDCTALAMASRIGSKSFSEKPYAHIFSRACSRAESMSGAAAMRWALASMVGHSSGEL